MSCCICEDDTISRAVAVLLPLNEMPSDEAKKALGQEILALNERAYKIRYPDWLSFGELNQEEQNQFEFDYSAVFGKTPIELLKSLQYVIYHCSEGDIPETSPLYDRLSDAAHKLMDEIVSELPEWKAAKWG
jgi:hypothetical protein